MKRITKLLLLVLPALMLLSACNKKSDSEPELTLFGTFATLASVSETGATFDVIPEGIDAQPVVMTTSWVKQNVDNIKAGDRYFIYFTNGTTDNPLKGGNIELRAMALCDNGGVTKAPLAQIQPLALGSYSLYALPSVTGMYVNVWVYSADGASGLGIYAAEETLDQAYPDLYVGINGSDTLYGRAQYLGSFNISEIWNLPTARGFRLHYEVNGATKVDTFEKKPYYEGGN